MTERTGRVVFTVLALASAATLLILTFGMTFFADDWAFIERASLSVPDALVTPHNEHWVALPNLVLRGLVMAEGLGSYVPYIVVLLALHVAVAWLVYRLLWSSSGPVIAVMGLAFVLLFGSGFENLFWATQIGFVGSTLLGLAAMLIVDGSASRSRALAAALLLTASLMCSGMGIVMCVAVGLEWLFTPRWRPLALPLLIPAAAYVVWFLAAGRGAVTTFRDPLTVNAIADIAPSVARGLTNGLGAAVALPGIGAAILIVAVVYGVWAWRNRRLHPRAPAVLAAIVVQYALIGVVRAQLFEGIVDYTRYTYVSGVLAMVGLGALVGQIRVPTAGRAQLAAVGALTIWLAVGLVAELQLLVAGREIFLERADMTRALATVALEPDQPPGVDPTRSLVLVPSPDELRRIVAAHGDVRTDSLVGWAIRPIPDDVLAEARRRLVEGAPIPGVSDWRVQSRVD